jgi:two-component sensor histidine kinase
VSYTGPDASLQGHVGQNFALSLHELATNSLKYGARSSAGGSIDIRWAVSDAPGMIRFNWTELGGPAVTPPKKLGFGTKLIRQLGPGVLLFYEPDGVRFQADLPCVTMPAK